MSHRRYKSNYDGKIAGLYDLEKTIGKGHFAVVKLARHVFTGEKVAVKVIDKTKLDETSRGHLFQEVRCMKLVQHPNVVRLYQVIDTQTKLYLILELGDGGDMYEYIMKHDRGLSEDVARLYFRQIVQAISYCHQLHVVHRDLKPENVVFFEKSGIVKLTDFGFSNKFIPGSKLETSCGSLAYSAPEILLGDLYDAPAVDVWSLGVILYMLVVGEAPFHEANDSETLTMIMDCKYHLPSSVTEECQQLINLMLVREPHQRASLHEIINHPWVTLGNPASVPLGPLISRESLSEGDHSYVIQRMVDGKIATKEDILSSLEKDSYNNVTATYYLLAERLLRSQRDCQSNTPSQQKKHSADADNSKPLLSPLALSPRVQSADVSKADKQRKNISSLVSPPGARAGGSGRQVAVGGRSPSPVDRGHGVMRRCSLIQEESFDEDEEDMEVEPAPETSSGRKDTSHQLRYSRSVDDGSFSDDSDTHSGSAAELNESPSRVTTRRRAAPIRPLHSVRSSPQLLNQIHEEGEESEGDELYSSRISPNRERARNSMASPEVLRKYGNSHRRRRTPGSRGTSCSSSDASDTDETDPSRKRRRDKLRHRFQRRDSSDHSSDTDGPGGPGGLGGGNRPFSGGAGKDKRRERHHRGENDENRHAHKDSKGGKGGGGGRQNGSLLGKRESNSTDNSQLEVDRKISNISITSNLSNLSLTSLNSRGSKYKMDTPTGSPKSSEDVNKDVESMNEENKARTRIIHVRSKEFSDLVDRFSTSGEERASYHPDKPKMRRRPKDKMKMDINRNGLITRTQCTMSDSDIKRPFEAQQINKTKCCSVV